MLSLARDIPKCIYFSFLYDEAEFYRYLLMLGGGCSPSLQFGGLSTLSFLYYMSVSI